MTNEEAIEVLASHLYHWERLFESRICSKKEGEETIEALKMAIKALEDRPTGKWEQDINGWHVCTNCHMQYRGMPTIDRKPRWRYCPNCGAKMKEAEND